MEKRNWLPLVLVGVLLAGTPAISGCVTTGDGDQGVKFIEEMSDAEYAKWQLYVSLGVKIGASRLLDEGAVSEEELDLAADAIELAKDSAIVAGATSLIGPALEDVGLTNDEITLVLLIAEQELLAHGALEDYIDPETGLLALSPRTKEMLQIIADSLRSATALTEEEALQGAELEADFGAGLVYVE